MKWTQKCTIMLIIAIPAFTGFPLDRFPAQPVPGIRWAWVAYFLTVNALLRLMLGGYIYSNIMAIAALVTIPVIFGGASVATIIRLVISPAPLSASPASAHYAGLCLNMLTVVPLALGIVASLPFRALEQKALTEERSISHMRKIGLMALRVFNHIAFFVAPNLLEVMREEVIQGGQTGGEMDTGRHNAAMQRRRYKGVRQIGRLVSYLIYLSVEGICAAIQNIPLWALELSRLPNRKDK